MDKDLYGILTLDSRVRGNDKNDKSRDYDSHPRESQLLHQQSDPQQLFLGGALLVLSQQVFFVRFVLTYYSTSLLSIVIKNLGNIV
jgi:hypothetical protein